MAFPRQTWPWIIGSLWAVTLIAVLLLTMVVPWGCWIADGIGGSTEGCESMMGWAVPFLEPQPTFAITMFILAPMLVMASTSLSIWRWRRVHGR